MPAEPVPAEEAEVAADQADLAHRGALDERCYRQGGRRLVVGVAPALDGEGAGAGRQRGGGEGGAAEAVRYSGQLGAAR